MISATQPATRRRLGLCRRRSAADHDAAGRLCALVHAGCSSAPSGPCPLWRRPSRPVQRLMLLLHEAKFTVVWCSAALPDPRRSGASGIRRRTRPATALITTDTSRGPRRWSGRPTTPVQVVSGTTAAHRTVAAATIASTHASTGTAVGSRVIW